MGTLRLVEQKQETKSLPGGGVSGSLLAPKVNRELIEPVSSSKLHLTMEVTPHRKAGDHVGRTCSDGIVTTHGGLQELEQTVGTGQWSMAHREPIRGTLLIRGSNKGKKITKEKSLVGGENRSSQPTCPSHDGSWLERSPYSVWGWQLQLEVNLTALQPSCTCA